MYKSYYVRIGRFKHELQARASEGILKIKHKRLDLNRF